MHLYIQLSVDAVWIMENNFDLEKEFKNQLGRETEEYWQKCFEECEDLEYSNLTDEDIKAIYQEIQRWRETVTLMNFIEVFHDSLMFVEALPYSYSAALVYGLEYEFNMKEFLKRFLFNIYNKCDWE